MYLLGPCPFIALLQSEASYIACAMQILSVTMDFPPESFRYYNLSFSFTSLLLHLISPNLHGSIRSSRIYSHC
jgi:hypothetical protein